MKTAIFFAEARELIQKVHYEESALNGVDTKN